MAKTELMIIGSWQRLNVHCEEITIRIDEKTTNLRAPAVQLVEHRAAMREVVRSTPVGPKIRVLKELKRKCYL